MEILADEDIQRPIVEMLRDRGFDVFHVDEEMKGALDQEVMEEARELERPVLTYDLHFLDVEPPHPGVVHITSRDRYGKVADAVEEILNTADKNDLKDAVFRVSP